ncbi:MAG TPA: hypothetical protein VLS94_09910, partial [Fusibacter sp.]|nr:hypothetical protein [Fusibacter sp.]
MKNRKNLTFTVTAVVLILSSLVPCSLQAQKKLHTHNETMSVSGTSSLHDWTEKSTKAEAEATFIISNGKITDVSA